MTYRTPCFPIYRKGHYGSFIGRGFETIDDFRALVAEVKKSGGHFIKLMISGLMDFNHYGVLTDEPMPENLIAELTKISHDEGFSVMAHANGDAAVRGAVKAGIDSVEHGAYLTDETASHALRKQNRLDADTGHNRKPDRRCQVPGERDKAASCLSAGRRPEGGAVRRISCPRQRRGRVSRLPRQGGWTSWRFCIARWAIARTKFLPAARQKSNRASERLRSGRRSDTINARSADRRDFSCAPKRQKPQKRRSFLPPGSSFMSRATTIRR